MVKLASVPAKSLQGDGNPLDFPLLAALLLVMMAGLVMVASASGSIGAEHTGNELHYLIRQGIFLVVGLISMVIAMLIPVEIWTNRLIWLLMLIITFALLLLLFTPLGKEVNGSRRWIPIFFFNLQPSEIAKLLMVFFTANFVSHWQKEIRGPSWLWFMTPVVVVGLVAVLIFCEPDLGSAAVVFATSLGVMFLAGARGGKLFLLLSAASGVVALAIIFEPYRMRRITSFLDPWSDPFDTGFQLVQSQIGYGRGHWFGEGLGNSVQKLQFLPEAHTDFIFTVIAEEFGLIGALLVIALMTFICLRSLRVGFLAERQGKFFPAYLAYGLALLFSIQFLVNIGVSSGVLPTKGLSLPLFSYGGSNLIMTCVSFGLLMRIDYERRVSEKPAKKKRSVQHD